MKLSKRLHLHPLFIVLIVASLFFGYFENIFFIYLITLLHEFSHIGVACLLGYRLKLLKIMPFGIEVRFAEEQDIPAKKMAVIAAAGPTMNMLLLFLVLPLRARLPQEAFSFLCLANLSLLLVNLLPAVPLDGGKILKAILLAHGNELSTARRALVVSKATALVMLGAGIFFFIVMPYNFSMLLIAAFVLVYALHEDRDYKLMQQKLLFHYKEKLRLSGEDMIPVRSFAARPSTPLRRLMRRFDLEYYNVVLMLNEEMRVCRQVTEGEVIDTVLRLGAGAVLAQVESDDGWSKKKVQIKVDNSSKVG